MFIETEFWQELKLISKKEAKSLTVIISNIDKNKKKKNLSSEIRLYILNHLKNN